MTGVKTIMGIAVAGATTWMGRIAATLATACIAGPALAANLWLAPAFPGSNDLGAAQARGVVVWSHGRSFEGNDATLEAPLYLRALRQAGWDVVRFNRSFEGDTLPGSARQLAAYADELRGRGYRQVVTAGQYFGGMISVMAAGRTDSIDAVVATAPAAFGSFVDSFDTWRKNGTFLNSALGEVKRARVMMFFFHGDEYDPGGRGPQTEAVLAGRGLERLIVDQPSDLLGHGAANSGLFVRRFGACIAEFIDAARRTPMAGCDSDWGRTPSPEITLSGLAPGRAGKLDGLWYGFWGNGRELALSVTTGGDGTARAEYVLGAGVTPDAKPERVMLEGTADGNALYIARGGRNGLRFQLLPSGRLQATWTGKDGTTMQTALRRISAPVDKPVMAAGNESRVGG